MKHMEVKLILSNFKSISLTDVLEKNCTNQAFCKLQGNVPPENLSKSNNSSNNDKAIIFYTPVTLKGFWTKRYTWSTFQNTFETLEYYSSVLELVPDTSSSILE